MKKLQQEHMQAVGQIANLVAINQMMDVLDEWMTELPSEFKKAKDTFKELEFEFNRGIELVVNKYVDD